MAQHECAICLKKVRKNGYRRCKNGHRYHKSCISKWLAKKDSCPQCRIPMRTRAEAELDSDDSESSEDENYQNELVQYQINMNLTQDIIEGVNPNYRVMFSNLSQDIYEVIVLGNIVRRLCINGIRVNSNVNSLFHRALSEVDMNSTIDLEELIAHE